jgi:hypothetical protein
MKKILLLLCLIYSTSSSQDPFALLGIPSLNPSQIFKDELSFNYKSEFENNQFKSEKIHPQNSVQPLKSIEDLPKFLQTANLNAEEGAKIISKFLISDDYLLKKYGAVFDQTGFDGIINLGEQIYPLGRNERTIQRARSAAKIYFKNNFKAEDYDAYGAERIMIENVPLTELNSICVDKV